MKLHWSPRSPFVRKVMVAAHELGLAERLRPVRTMVAMTQPAGAYLAENPLGKIPALVLEDGTVLYDSLVILEHLDGLAGGGRLIPREAQARLIELRRHALGNGLLDLLVLWRNARDMPQPFQPWIENFERKAQAALDALETEIGAVASVPPGIAQITIGCACAYLDFRFPALGWREGRPRLAAWEGGFAQRPSMRATAFEEG